MAAEVLLEINGHKYNALGFSYGSLYLFVAQ